ncbi:MAG: diguanylate cyclase, partial [Candidatus Aminicenantales bacterium]
MSQKQILILHPSLPEVDRLSKLAMMFGPVTAWTDMEGVRDRLKDLPVRTAIIDAGFARYSIFRNILGPATAIILTGPNDGDLREAADEWPREFYVDPVVLSSGAPRESSFIRALERALEHARVKAEAEDLRRSLAQQETKLRDVYSEIREIKSLINANFIQEIEKRIAIETKYVWFQKERQRIESILRKIYAADDISSLLDILPDIRDIVKASSATVYIIEENDHIGRYLKPLVWDNAYLSHADFSKYIALWDSQDFAATVARYGQAINLAELTFDRRMTKRYTEFLRAPLKNLLTVPIMHSRKVIGVVEVYNKTVQGKALADGFSREDLQILQGISEHMAIAMMKLNLIQYDALTSLLRPEPFFDKVLQKIKALGKRRREEGGLALVMGDVDWFKAYNDRNGHEAGNRLLRELAHVLKLSIREEDLLCRYGGEEFLFFLTGVNTLDEAAVLTDRIRKNV